jgi:hypothetical protein
MHAISLHVTEPDEAREICGRVYYPHRLTVLHEPARFAMSLSALNLGPVAVGLLGYAGEVRLETAELETGYEVNVPLSGRLLTRSGPAEVYATPDTAALYRPDGRARLQGWADGGELFGLKIARPALEARLAELAGTPVRGVVGLGPSLDLRAGAGLRWWALARALAALTADPDGPLTQPMVVRPLVDSVLVALLYAADHPYRAALAAPCPRAGRAADGRPRRGQHRQPLGVHQLRPVRRRLPGALRTHPLGDPARALRPARSVQHLCASRIDRGVARA